MIKKSFTISGKVLKFPNKGGWFYISVPRKYTKTLKEQRKVWGKFPIIVRVNKTSWKTKLMLKKGGDFFIAFNKKTREKENIVKDKLIKVNFYLM